jgi:CheY-like chemotaxis protein
MSERSTRRGMQPAADGDRSKLDPRGKVGTEDIRAWLIVGYKLFAELVEAKMFHDLEGRVLPLEDDEDAVGAINEIDLGVWKGPIPDVILIDISVPTISAVDIGQRLKQSQKLKNMVIILISERPPTAADIRHLWKNADADTVMSQPLPNPQEFKQVITQLLLNKHL